MPRTVTITGSFHHHDRPVQGLVRFVPDRLWVMQDGVAWACLAPEARLAKDGSFSVQVTPTDTDECWWQYVVDTPAGLFTITTPWVRTGYTLRELIHEHHPGTRPPD